LIDGHAADVDASTAEFYCCRSSPSLSIDAYVRRSRFVVLAAHRLVYVGDIIARHVIDQSVDDRIATAANELYSQQKTSCHDDQERCFGNRRFAERRPAESRAQRLRRSPSSGCAKARRQGRCRRRQVEGRMTSTRSKDGRAADQRSGAQANGGGPPASDTRQSLYTMPAVTFSFRFSEGQSSWTNKTKDESLVSCRQACNIKNILDSVSIQLSVFIYII